MGNKRDIQASPKSTKGKRKPRPSRPKVKEIQQGGNSIRFIQERRVRHCCCYDEERQKGLGAVLFTLGIPSVIAGLIMTIVAATDNDHNNKYPKAFIATGPVLLVLALIFFCSGIILHSSSVRKAFRKCFSLNDPKGFCRVHCPTLSQCLHPDDSIAINQAAIKALQTEPGKSVLKRNRLLSDPSVNVSAPNFPNGDLLENDVFNEEDTNTNRASIPSKIKLPRGVHFSDGDISDTDLRRKRTGSNSSLLSLKHCKISPKEEIWWTDEHNQSKTIQMSDLKEESLQTTEL